MSWIVSRVCTPTAIFQRRLKRMIICAKRVFLQIILESTRFDKCSTTSRDYLVIWGNILVEWLFAKDNWMRLFHWKTPACPGAQSSNGTKMIAKIWESLKWICSVWG